MKAFLLRFLSAGAFFAIGSSAVWAAAGWEEDYAKAVARAKTEKKMLLLDFTGSDWCPPCMKLEKEVFSTPEFKNYAKDNLVLMEVDFPQYKQLAKPLEAQNWKLKEEYGVEGFPMLIVLNFERNKTRRFEYEPGGPKPFIAKLNALKGK
jgi:thioredoxin-related protein